NAALLVEQDRVRLFTDFRYIDAARAVADVEVVQTRRALVGELAETLTGRIGFETILPFEQYRTLEGGGLDLVPRAGLVEALRAVKEETELEILRRACRITDRVFERLLDVRFIGRREREVAWDLAGFFHDEGADGMAFEFIVGSGPTGSHPPGRAGDREIGGRGRDVINAVGRFGRSRSGRPRRRASAPIEGRMREAYEVVGLAQAAALGGIRAGLSGVEADALAREIIDASGFRGAMGHGLGHGLGLEVHEDPRLSTESTDM